MCAGVAACQAARRGRQSPWRRRTSCTRGGCTTSSDSGTARATTDTLHTCAPGGRVGRAASACEQPRPVLGGSPLGQPRRLAALLLDGELYYHYCSALQAWAAARVAPPHPAGRAAASESGGQRLRAGRFEQAQG